MKRKCRIKHLLLIFALYLLCFVTDVSAGTTVSTTGNINLQGGEEAGRQLQKISDRTGAPIAKSTILANLSGYPLGTACLEKFPSFFAGLSTASAFSNMRYFDSDRSMPDGAYPFITANPAIYFGLGINGRLDVIGKIFLFSDGLYRPPLDYQSATLKKLNIFSTGAKLRYNYFPRKPLLPGLLEFGGLTFAGGIDFQYSNTGIKGFIRYEMSNIETGLASPDDLLDSVTYESNYEASAKWYSLTGSGTALVYLDFFWIFSFYTGFGIAVNWGLMTFKANGTGPVYTADADYLANQGTSDVGTLSFNSSNSYRPYYAAPIYVAGLDINIYLLHLAFQTQVNLWNRQDVTLELGCRFQY